jgi:hypothetical protein
MLRVIHTFPCVWNLFPAFIRREGQRKWPHSETLGPPPQILVDWYAFQWTVFASNSLSWSLLLRFADQNLLLYISSLSHQCPYLRNDEIYPYFDFKVLNKLLSILGSFAKSRRATVRCTMFVRPQGRSLFPVDGFWWNFILWIFTKICRPV